MSTEAKLAIIGRERALIDALTTALQGLTNGPPTNRMLAEVRRHRSSRKWETSRGSAFEVQLHDPDGNVTGHIVRITVELDRLEDADKETGR